MLSNQQSMIDFKDQINSSRIEQFSLSDQFKQRTSTKFNDQVQNNLDKKPNAKAFSQTEIIQKNNQNLSYICCIYQNDCQITQIDLNEENKLKQLRYYQFPYENLNKPVFYQDKKLIPNIFKNQQNKVKEQQSTKIKKNQQQTIAKTDNYFNYIGLVKKRNKIFNRNILNNQFTTHYKQERVGEFKYS